MLRDLSEALADVALKLGVWVRDEGGKVRYGTLVDDCLSQLFGVLSDFRQSGSRDTLESQLGLLDAQDQKTDRTGINDGLSKIFIVLCDARKRKRRSLLHRGVEFFKAVDQRIEGARVNNGLSKVRRVLRNRAENIGGSFFVETLQYKI